MATVIIVGAQWGDEGKGKIVDLLTEFADIVVRHQGGNNAGHTLVHEGVKQVLHLVPSGVLHKNKRCVIAPGVVVDPAVLCQEIDQLTAAGYLQKQDSLRVAHQCHVIMPYHKAIDNLREAALGDGKIGTTGRGIGPVYEDKASRRGIRLIDLLRPESFAARVRANLDVFNALAEHYYHGPTMDDGFIEQYLAFGERLAPYMSDVVGIIHDGVRQGRHLLFEGAQGAMLDPDHGTYPFNTSSPTTAGGALTGAGVGPKVINEVLGITKAYTTRVGGGPFPTELTDATGEYLRRQGGEFGSTTGRARRCGWLDAVVLRHAVRINGMTGLAITKLDVLTGMKTLRICVGYRHNGAFLDSFPADPDMQQALEPVYEDLPGWTQPITQARDWDDLPAAAQRFVSRIVELTGVSACIVSVGAGRTETLLLRNPFRVQH